MLPVLRVFEAAFCNRSFRQAAAKLPLSPSAELSALRILKQQGKANATVVQSAQRSV